MKKKEIYSPHEPSTQLLTVGQVAENLGISEVSVRRLLNKRQLDFYKINGVVRVSREQLNEYLDSTRVPSINAQAIANQMIGGNR